MSNEPIAEGGSTLDRVSALVATLGEVQSKIAKAEEELKSLKADKNEIEMTDLPELMRELGFSEVRLTDGRRVSVEDQVDCSIKPEHQADAHKWLVDNGFGGLIKFKVEVTFDKDEKSTAAARELVDDLLDLGRDAILFENVHPATLKSFVKEQLAAGKNVPMELFGVYPYVKAKITKK